MITTTVELEGQTWTLTGVTPTPLNPTPGVRVTAPDGAEMTISRRKATNVVHLNGCTIGTRIGATCTCTKVPADPAPLYDAARDITNRVAAAEAAKLNERPTRSARTALSTPTARPRRGCDCTSGLYGGCCTC